MSGCFQSRKTSRARKAHRCRLCGEGIQKGEWYMYETGRYNGEFYKSFLHLSCDRLKDRYLSENNEYEWDPENISEWLADTVCSECIHGPEYEQEHEDWTDCPHKNRFRCPEVLRHCDIEEAYGT